LTSSIALLSSATSSISTSNSTIFFHFLLSGL